MTIFLVSLVPAVFAAQGNANQRANTPTQYAVGGDRENFVAQAEQQRQNLIEKREVAIGKQVRQKINVADKKEELLKKFQENKEQLRERVANAVQKRTEAINRYNEAKGELVKAKEKIKNCEGKQDVTCTEERRKTRQNAQKFLQSSMERALGLLEKTRERIENSKTLTEEEKTAAIADLEDRMEDIASVKETIEETTSDASAEEIKESTKMARESWQKANKEMKQRATQEASAKIGGTLVKIEKLTEKLDRTIEQLQAKGYDTTPIETMMQQFENKIQEGKDAQVIAEQKFNEGNANEATVNIQAAHKRIKEAHMMLKDVVRKIRKANQGEKVSEGLEPETEAEQDAAITEQDTTEEDAE